MVIAGLPRINIAGDFIIKAGTQIEPRTIEDYELAYLPNRSGTRYFCSSGAYMLDTPCYIITKPGEEHGYSFDPEHPTRILFIHFDFGGLPTPDDYFTVLQPGAVPFIPADDLSFVPNVLKRMFQVMADTGGSAREPLSQPVLWRIGRT